MARLLRFWTAITMPAPVVPLNEERERYARFNSRFVFVFFLISFLAIPLEIPAHQMREFPVTILGCVLYLMAGALNRFGWIRLSGVMCIATIIIGLMCSYILFTPLNMASLPILCLFSISVIVTGLLLRPISMIFVVALINCVIVIFLPFFLPIDPSLRSFLQSSSGFDFYIKPVSLILESALATYIVVFSLSREIKRANGAEEIARLEKLRASDRHELQKGVEQISLVLELVAQGHLDARCTLTEGSVLFSIAVPLNDLLDQTQRLQQEVEHSRPSEISEKSL